MTILSQPVGAVSPPRPTVGRGNAPPALVLVIVCAGVVLASLDLFIVNVALPQIGRDFHLRAGGLADLSWVLNAYAIVYASFLVLFGRLAERHRRERGFLLGVGVFVAASAACGAASSLPTLVVFRIIQAAGAALLTPTSLGLILATFPAQRRHGAVRTWTAVGGLAAAAGPVIGGLLVALSWRWVFLVNVPVGLLALVVGWRRLPAVPGQPVPVPGLLGAALITGGVGALVLGLVKGGAWGWTDPRTLTALATGAAALVLFAVDCARSSNPMIDRVLWRLRPVTGCSAVAFLFMASFGGMLLSRVLWAQEVWHWSALSTGLAIAPGPIMVPLFSFLAAGRLIARFGAGRVIAGGSMTFAAGVAWWALAMGLRPDYAGEMLGGMLLTGIGVGLTLPTFMATGAAALPAHSFATGSALINMFRQIGLAVGVAVLIAVLGAAHSQPQTLLVYQRASWIVAGLALSAGLAGLLLLSPRRAGDTALRAAPGHPADQPLLREGSVGA
jgi:EmrB/QacA subfamily drug resistance transporter